MNYDIAMFFEKDEIADALRHLFELNQNHVVILADNPDPESFLLNNSLDLLIVQGKADSQTVKFIQAVKKNGGSVLVVAEIQENNADEFLSIGVDEYLLWPATPIQTETRIHALLNWKQGMDFVQLAVEKKTQELLEVQSVMIESLASLAEYRDNDTGEHIRRTQNYVKALAKELRKNPKYAEALGDEAIDMIYLSVPLHDIGKVGVPDYILLKPGKLTPEEFEIMKQHATIGYEAIISAERKLNNNSFLNYAAAAAYTHHEKWDGSGYPRGIAGEEIPLIGRIMAVADVYDALVTKRVYKDAIDHEKARTIILEGSGTHFDPDVVKAFDAVTETFRSIEMTYSDVIDLKVKNEESKRIKNYSTVKNVLLVDDSKLMLSMFTNLMTSDGFHVIAASDAQKAFQLFQQEEFDLIITDIEMPEINGFEFVRMIRDCSHPKSKSVLIFALTASEFNLSLKEARAKGFSDYMLKPLDIDLLKYKLEHIMIDSAS